MGKFDIHNIQDLNKLNNELDLEQANSLYIRLRPLAKDDPSIKSVRKHLAALIKAYEEEHWSDDKAVTDEQVKQSDYAEKLVAVQNDFIQARKKLIRSKLKKYDLAQNDLAEILGHRKNYMSELINGARPFSKDDIVIIHRILDIPLNKLVDRIIKENAAIRVRKVIARLNKPQLKLKDGDLNLELT